MTISGYAKAKDWTRLSGVSMMRTVVGGGGSGGVCSEVQCGLLGPTSTTWEGEGEN